MWWERCGVSADKTDQNKPVSIWQVSRGAGTDEVYREFRTNRRPLNVASVVSRTVEQETSSVPAPRETGGMDQFRWGFDAWVVCCCANGYHTVVIASTL